VLQSLTMNITNYVNVKVLTTPMFRYEKKRKKDDCTLYTCACCCIFFFYIYFSFL